MALAVREKRLKRIKESVCAACAIVQNGADSPRQDFLELGSNAV